MRKRVERGLSESRDENNDFYRIPTRFTTRYIPQYPTMRRIDSDKPLPPIKRLRALRQPGYRLNLPFSPRGEAKWVRGPSGRGASRAEEKGARNMACKVFHESRVTAFSRVLRPSGGGKCRLMDVSRSRLTFPGPQVTPSGEVKGERDTNRETKPLIRRAAQASASSKVFTKHETRDTNHGFFRHEVRNRASWY